MHSGLHRADGDYAPVMAKERRVAALSPAGRLRRQHPCVPVRNEHYVDSASRRFRVLKITSWIAALISGGFGVWQLLGDYGVWWIGLINILTGCVFLGIPLLCPFGELVAPLAFIAVAYGSVFFLTWNVGTDGGSQFYFIVSASILVLVLGIERIVLAGILTALGALLVIILSLDVPNDTGLQPAWTLPISFAISVVSASVMALATVWYAMRETARAEVAMDLEYTRSETLLSNMLPASIAIRLKDPTRDKMIADRYDDASILFADIAGFTERASDTAPCDLVAFLDRLYTEFDLLVDRHGLEKVKTSGDSYMVVSGVPSPTGSSAGAGRAGPRHVQRRCQTARPRRSPGADPDRHRSWPGGRRGGRITAILLRRMG